MKKVLVVLNPRAGTMKSKNGLFTIVDGLCSKDYTVTVQTTQRQGHATELVERASESGFDLIVCCGGDGTLNEVINGMMRCNSKVVLGYIPTGSTNDFANSMGIPTNINKAVENILTKEPVDLDIGQFNDRYFSYIASFGAFTMSSYSAPQSMKNSLGHFAYLLQGIKDLGSLRQYRMKLKSDNADEENDYIFGAVSNSTSVGGLVKLNSDIVDMRDGLFEMVMIKYPKNFSELNKIINGIFSSDYSADVFTFDRSARIEFDMEDVLPWTLDGEYEAGQNHIDIINRHAAIKIIQ